MKYKITQIRKYGKGLYESEKIGQQWYNVVHARLYPARAPKGVYYRIKFIHMFDNEDLDGFFNYDESEPQKDTFTQQDIKECRDELIYAAAESLFYGENMIQIYDNCRETIKRYDTGNYTMSY